MQTKKKFTVDYINRVILLVLLSLLIIGIGIKIILLPSIEVGYRDILSYVAIGIGIFIVVLGLVGLKTVYKHIKE